MSDQGTETRVSKLARKLAEAREKGDDERATKLRRKLKEAKQEAAEAEEEAEQASQHAEADADHEARVAKARRKLEKAEQSGDQDEIARRREKLQRLCETAEAEEARLSHDHQTLFNDMLNIGRSTAVQDIQRRTISFGTSQDRKAVRNNLFCLMFCEHSFHLLGTHSLLFDQLRVLEASIQAIQAEIDETKSLLKSARDQKEMDFLRSKELLLREQLRTKEQQLHDELKPLRATELQLMEETKRFPDVGTLPYPVNAGFSQGVWAAMCLEVQQRVLDLRQAESKLAAIKALSNMRAGLEEKDAAKFGIEVLFARDGKVQLGVFDVPDVDTFLGYPPKGA